MKYHTDYQDDKVSESEIFVFGSNLAGRHGKGAAEFAHRYKGAQYGVGVGPTGNSYAIPTKDVHLKVLPLDIIEEHIRDFLIYAKIHYNRDFYVSRIGCGLAGYKDSDIAPLFYPFSYLDNIIFPIEWKK